ncbi:MAG: sugar-specific transcriptional regulator TrmB [Candidatus Methanoperedens sp.]|nr:sugar-specific transcriptional regulator TrmB [Candidatus Methanoperedens sp.]
MPDYKKTIFDLYIIGLINIDELAMWVLGVDRRVIVIKTMHKYGLIKASDIAEKTGRSLQNISHGLRELEERGLIRCITPEKHTWKRYILTEKGTEVFEKLRKNHLIN